MAAHIRGNIEVGVKPGIVLISLITSGAVGQHEEVDPGQSLAAERLEGARRHLAQLGGHLVGQVGRHVELGVLLGEVLGREVVELVLPADPDLGRHAGLRRAVERLEHPALDLAGADGRLLDQRLGVVPVGLLDGGVELGRRRAPC